MTISELKTVVDRLCAEGKGEEEVLTYQDHFVGVVSAEYGRFGNMTHEALVLE